MEGRTGNWFGKGWEREGRRMAHNYTKKISLALVPSLPS